MWQNGDSDRALAVGDSIGAAFWRTQTGHLATIYSPLFALVEGKDGTQTVMFQHADPIKCHELIALDGLTLDELFARIEACPTPNETAIANHDRMSVAAPYAYLPLCYRPDPPSCGADPDCADGEVCDETVWLCVARPSTP